MPNLSILESAQEDDTNWVSYNNPKNPIGQRVVEVSLARIRESYYTNSIFHLVVSTQADFLVSDGFTLNVQPEAAASWAQNFWDNEIDPLLPSLARELLCFGELLAIVDRSTPLVPEVIFCSPQNIVGCETLKNNKRKLARLTIKDDEGEEETLPVFGFASRQDKRVAVFLAIECFGDNLRSNPPFMHLLDLASVFDKSNVALLARLPALFAIWWDVTLQGFTPERVRQWNQENGGFSPPPGSIIAHNDAVSWDIKSAAGAARSTPSWNAFFKELILTSGGISPMLFSGMSYRYSDANNPTFKALYRLKKQLARFFEQIMTLSIHGAGFRNASVEIPIEDLMPADSSRLAATTDRYIRAINTAVEAGFLEPEQARELVQELLRKAVI